MIIKTKDFQDAANKILLAAGLDQNAANLEVVAKESNLYLNVTNKEFFVSVKFPLETEEIFRAVVDAKQFLDLISGFTTETFSLILKGNTLELRAGKSKYKIAMIYENDQLMTLPAITIQNKTVEMSISNDILMSILNVNSKEVEKTKNIDVNELQRLYFIDETGCFTFATGACLNSFTLEKPVKLLLNDRIVKLFKLFKEDVNFTLGQDPMADGSVRTKITLQTADTYLAAIITCDDILISKVQGPCMATKRFISENYSHRLVLPANEVSSAITRLMKFTKNNKAATEKVSTINLPVSVKITADEFIIKDKFENVETIDIENGSYTDGDYEMVVNLYDIKLVVDSCKNEHITFNCGNGRSIIITRGAISNLIPELSKV